jgi:hypothetical protein
MSLQVKYSVCYISNDATFMVDRECHLHLVQVNKYWVVITKQGEISSELKITDDRAFERFHIAEARWLDERVRFTRNLGFRESLKKHNVDLTDQEKVYLLLKY